MKWFLSLVCLGLSLVVYGQNELKISGVVKDAASGEPMPFADVFFANTFQGVNTNTLGQFELKVESEGVYQLVIRFVGYITHTQTIEVGDEPLQPLEILLYEEVTNLGSFTVIAKNDRQWREYFNQFQEIFIGTSTNATKCDILNKHDIDFYFDSENDVLYAYADEPLRIKNDALGYYINYYLEKFLLDKKSNLSLNLGYNTFESMDASSDRKRKVWEQNRDKAYNGSIWHFFSTLHQNTLEDEGFIIQHVPFVDGKEFRLNPKQVNLADFVITSPNGSTKRLTFKDYLRITYTKEDADRNFQRVEKDDRGVFPVVRTIRSEVSLITMLEGSSYIEFEENGFIRNPLSFLREGYWGFEKVADMVPMNYKPKQ